MKLQDKVTLTAPDSSLGRRARGFKGQDGVVAAVGANKVVVQYPDGQILDLPQCLFRKVES